MRQMFGFSKPRSGYLSGGRTGLLSQYGYVIISSIISKVHTNTFHSSSQRVLFRVPFLRVKSDLFVMSIIIVPCTCTVYRVTPGTLVTFCNESKPNIPYMKIMTQAYDTYMKPLTIHLIQINVWVMIYRSYDNGKLLHSSLSLLPIMPHAVFKSTPRSLWQLHTAWLVPRINGMCAY